MTREQSKSYVPAQAHVLTPYICPRECTRAIAWYVEVFGASEVGERYVDADGRVGHAEINLDGALLMLSDGFPDYGAEAPPEGNRTATFALNLYVPDADATLAAAERAGAHVQRPVEEQAYGSRMGAIIDPFGVRWMIATQIREVDQEELDRQAREWSGA